MAKPTEKQKIEFLELLSSGLSFESSAKNVGCEKQDFYRLAVIDEEFDGRLARARDKQQDALTAETLELADNCDESNVNSTKLKIWARQWYAGKCAARRYGDKITQEISGKDGGPLVFKWQDAATKKD